MTAPAGSAIVPVIVPEPAWPKAIQAQTNRQSAIHSDFIRLFLLLIWVGKVLTVGRALDMETSECECADPKKTDISRATESADTCDNLAGARHGRIKAAVA